MNKNVFSTALLVLMMLTSLVGQKTTPTTPLQTTHVNARGCVKPGSVSGCYVVNDYKAHKKYNVFFHDAKPDMGTGISFEGIAYGHKDPHCNQGQKVDVSEWKPVEGECPQTQKQ